MLAFNNNIIMEYAFNVIFHARLGTIILLLDYQINL